MKVKNDKDIRKITQKMTNAFEYYRIIKLPNIRDTANAQSKKLWEIIFDKRLKFENHVNTNCQKANKKMNTLASIIPYVELTKRCVLMNAFLDSRFNYCSFIWMYSICLFLFGFKNQLWNGSLVIAPADYAKLIYHMLVSYGINFEKGNKSFPTAQSRAMYGSLERQIFSLTLEISGQRRPIYCYIWWIISF